MAYSLLLFAYYFCKDKETKLICDNLFEHCKINITISGLPRRPLITLDVYEQLMIIWNWRYRL